MNREGNGLRASAISHRLGLSSDVQPTALDVGNSPETIQRDYLQLTTKTEAVKWFAIAPKVIPAREAFDWTAWQEDAEDDQKMILDLSRSGGMMTSIADVLCLTPETQKINSMSDNPDWDEPDSIPSDPLEHAKRLEAQTDEQFRQVYRRLYELDRLEARVRGLEGWVAAASGVLIGLLVLIIIAVVVLIAKSAWMRLFG